MHLSEGLLSLQSIAPKGQATALVTRVKQKPSPKTEELKMPLRTRLPPRSRTGCWTCRGRKVKCDEKRPNCAQCVRLGHKCDYGPRLCFRDDTAKVLERMHSIFTDGSPVWDATTRSRPRTPPTGSSSDALPSFRSLTTDIEREIKAEHYSPGTYVVVVNPSSFESLPEYTEAEKPATSRASPGDDSNRTTSPVSSRGHQTRRYSASNLENSDPNVVILARFEESLVPNFNYWQSASRPPPPGSGAESPSTTEPEDDQTGQGCTAFTCPVLRDNSPQAHDEESRLLQQFRTVVWRHLVHIDWESIPSEIRDMLSIEGGLFEQRSSTFRPLYHAMMAVSALSLSHQDHGMGIHALQRYQETLPFLQTSLHSDQDLSSDGVLLTHLLLLIYEISAAEAGGSNLWSYHLRQIIRIFYMRRGRLERDPLSFVIWWVFNIDLYGLFSGAGTGEFVEAMLENHMLPPPSCHLYPVSPDGTSIIFSTEAETLPAVLQLNHELVILAARLGLLAAKWRREDSAQAYDGQASFYRSDKTAERTKVVFHFQQSFHQVWTSCGAPSLEQQANILPPRSKELLQQCSALFNALLIYSYTSMWASQGIETGGPPALEIEDRVSSILRVANEIVSIGRFDLHFIVFPIFMAGVASSSPSLRVLALDLLSSIENSNEGVGRNVATTRHVLQLVYQRQTESHMRRGHSLDVSWIQIMLEQGLQVIHFGL